MKSIVTGGAGFIGSHLVDALLKRGDEVNVIDICKSPKNLPQFHDYLNYIYADIRHSGIFDEIPDCIFHLAAIADIVPSIENPAEYFHANVTGTLNILEAARKSGCKKFIYAASASCYGDTPLIPTAEYSPNKPQYPYALTKYLGEQLVMHWSKVYGIPAISLRLFNVYGPRSRTNGTYGAMFGTFLAQLANEKPLTIVGDGTQGRDFIYISDVVDAMLIAADSDKLGIYNIGTGKPTSVNRIVELLGAKETVNIPKRPGEPDITCADISKIKKDLNWEPKVSIEEGVAELLEHVDSYKNAPVWVAATIEKATSEWFRRLA